MRRVLIGTALAFGALASPALAADEVVTGTDALVWDKPSVSVQPGEKVTWQFAGTVQAHHVASNGADVVDDLWTQFNSPFGAPAPNAEFVFTTPGAYRFICTIHSDTMVGTVYVGTTPAPPPGPLPLSQQPLANDVTAAPVSLEKIELDKAKPKLSKVSARRVARSAVRVGFRVNEQSTVLVSLKRGGKTVKKATLVGTGTGAVTLKGAKAGRYSVQVRATDVAGNVSSLKTTRITVR